MRIRDLLESQDFKEFINSDDGSIDYDLVEDLSFFMNHDDDTYRRHLYPAIVKCIHNSKNKKETSPAIFKIAATESYKNYIKKYPIRELPDELDSKLIEDVCKKVYEDICKHIEDGKYKN